MNARCRTCEHTSIYVSMRSSVRMFARTSIHDNDDDDDDAEDDHRRCCH